MIPVTGNFIHGKEYEMSVRLATNTRWETDLMWFPFCSRWFLYWFLRLEVTRADGTIVFHHTWPSFVPHRFCTKTGYRFRMMRHTRFKFAHRLSEVMEENLFKISSCRSSGTLWNLCNRPFRGVVWCSAKRNRWRHKRC